MESPKWVMLLKKLVSINVWWWFLKISFFGRFSVIFHFPKISEKKCKIMKLVQGQIYLILSIYMASTIQRGVKTKTHMSKFQKCTLMAKLLSKADRPFGVRGQNTYQVRPKFSVTYHAKRKKVSFGKSFYKPIHYI